MTIANAKESILYVKKAGKFDPLFITTKKISFL